MKRSLKNGIMVGIIILMIGAIYLTLNMNKSSVPNGNPPSMPNNSESFRGTSSLQTFSL